jgi:ABC-type branched-subunit amino acid transport system substrate-binding protein
MVVVLLPAAVAAACWTIGWSSSPHSHRPVAGGAASGPGITRSQIQVGAIATRTGPGAGDFAAFVPGMEAYFDNVDAHGGIDGRKIVVTANLDDGGSPAQFTQDAHTLLEQNHVFAACISTFWFTPGLFTQTGTPTYGYNVSNNWAGPDNLFAAGGSIQDYHALAAPVAYLMKRSHSRSLALVSYGPGIPGSYPACHTVAQDLAADGIEVSYTGLDASLGGDYTAQVQQIAQRHSDFVLTCMEDSDDVTLARDIQQYGLKVHQLWLNGYSQALLNSYASVMQGVTVDANGFVPFSAVTTYPGVYPGMQSYLAMMRKYQPAFVTSQLAMQGWQSASLLAAGIRAAGTTPTQPRVIAETNRFTSFTAGGTAAVTNWTKAHTTQSFPTCPSFVQVRGKHFVPVVTGGHQVFICFDRSVDLQSPTAVAPPPGTPG